MNYWHGPNPFVIISRFALVGPLLVKCFSGDRQYARDIHGQIHILEMVVKSKLNRPLATFQAIGVDKSCIPAHCVFLA